MYNETLTTGILMNDEILRKVSYIAASEVATLEHELRDDTMKLGAGVAKAFLAGAESTEVLGGLGDNLVIELEVDTPFLLCDTLSVSCWTQLENALQVADSLRLEDEWSLSYL